MEKDIQSSLPSGALFELTSLTHWDDVNQPLEVEGTLKFSGFGSSAGRRLLVPATIFEVPQARPFQASRRTNMIYFHYPFEITDELQYHAPAGYTVETLPAAQKVDSGGVKYEISVTKQPDGMTVKRHLLVNVMLISAQSYPAVRQFFSTVKSDDEAQVVFQNTQCARNN